ncbi:hypothetical protein BC827DRAFT_1103266, partial [Russula dissimulans]
EYTGNEETNTMIWSGTRKPSISKKIQQFLFKSMHSTQKIGTYWANVRGNENRQFCDRCDTTETMDHILTECEETLARMIWGWAQHYWPHKKYEWPNICLGTILGC